jgi:hypothetical protein
MKKLILVLLLVAAPLGAATRNNDDSCDVGIYPAATLLVPYFEVTINQQQSESRENTIVTITNTGAAPQAARVTLWTDWAYPVISFNIYLTGYDVHKIDLFDVIGRGRIAGDNDMGADTSNIGELSEDDNLVLEEESCTDLPLQMPRVFIDRMQSAFTTGKVAQIGTVPACNTVGGVHTNAVGYATIDVVAVCTGSLPTDANYFTHELRFDNVLVGDYVQIGNDQQYAQGNPLVHIRAVPEGGTAATRKKTNLSRTFYSHLQPEATRTLDGRQPLPSTFGARWIDAGATGFETFYKIWRETKSTAATVCSAIPTIATDMPYEAVRFDEDENPEGYAYDPLIVPVPEHRFLWATQMVTSSEETVFPPNTMNSVAGWMYLNLNYDEKQGPVVSQNWVTVSMRSEKRFSVDTDAIAFGNGCSPAAPPSTGTNGKHNLGPVPNVTP